MWAPREVSAQDGKIRYSLLDLRAPWSPAGEDPPVVFLHGLGLSSEIWVPWFPEFVRKRRVIAVDLRGHAGSQAAWVQSQYSLDTFVEDVLAVLDDIAVPACHFVGESFGGTIGLHMAAFARSRLRSLTVCSTGFKSSWISGIDKWPELLATQGVEAWSRQILQGRFNPATISPDIVKWIHAMQCAVPPHVILGVVKHLQELDLEEELRGIRLPLLIVTAGGSPFVDMKSPLALRELVPWSDSVFLRDAWHSAVISHWPQCSRLVADFIERAEQTDPLTSQRPS